MPPCWKEGERSEADHPACGGAACWPWYLGLVVYALLASMALAEPLEIGNLESYRPSRELRYLVDAERRLDLDGLLSEARAERLPSLGHKRPHFGYDTSAVWMYLQVQNSTNRLSNSMVEVAHPLLGDVQAWVLLPDESPRDFHGGQTVPMHEWPLRNRSFAFPVELLAGQRAEIVLRATSQSSLQLPITLWSAAAFHTSHREAYMVLGLFYGITLSLLCYSLLLYVLLRDRNHLHYVAFVASYLLLQLTLNGLGFEFLWPTQTVWAQLATPLLGGSTMILGLIFARGFLELPQRAPWANRVVSVMAAAFVLEMAVALVIGPRPANSLLAALSGSATLLLIVIGSVCAWRGQAQARIYLIAWLAALIGVALYAGRALGLLPDVFITEYGVQVGSVLQLFLLSVALARRMQEIEVKHAMQLEGRVADRTCELNAALERLDLSYGELASKQRLFEALVEAKEAVREVEDPDLMLSIALSHLARARPELGVGFLAREPNRPKLIHHVCFQNVEAELRDPVLEALRGLPVNALAPVALKDCVPVGHGMLIPVHASLRQVEGFFLVLGGRQLAASEVQDCALFAHHIGAILEALLLRLKLERIANTDPLTTAFNRNYFNGLLDKAIRDKQAYPPVDFSAVMADLNGLKQINDRHGHEAGDQLIRAASRLLQRVCRRSDTIIRWGGDEFLVFCPGTRALEAANLMERLHAANGEACRIPLPDGGQIDAVIDFSFGVASSSEDPADEVIALADARMLESKAELYRERRRRYR